MTNYDNKRKQNILLVRIATFILLLVCILWFLNFWLLNELDSTERGTYGDMFGAVNALFSGLAFGGIVLTIYLQNRQLRAQGEELARTRTNVANQTQTMQLQRFETTFFNLMSAQRELTKGIKGKFIDENNETKELEGREIFIRAKQDLQCLWDELANHAVRKELIRNGGPSNAGRDELKDRGGNQKHTEQLLKDYKIEKEDLDSLRKRPVQEQLAGLYDIFLKRHRDAVGYYFRHLYHLLKYVVESAKTMNELDVKKYAGYIQAQMSLHEMVLTFYNASSYTKIREKIKETDLLHNMDVDALLDMSHDCFKDILLRKEKS